ncbi:MAG: transcriptional repressor [Actinobacteria bacterium]|nr:transcriptional repressor [Actinomycetota bacterium]MBW3642795.1 transcriptional repressor [Actinomycetota bacterium]
MPVAPLIERLEARRWRITPQRRAVAETLVGEHVHLSADEVFSRARTGFPDISRATVYNTLNELVAMGEVGEVRSPTGPVLYDPNGTDRHHHLVCTGCGTLFDVRPEGVDALHLAPGQRHGFRVEDVEVVFRGRCGTCP